MKVKESESGGKGKLFKCERRGEEGAAQALEVATVIRPRREWTIRSLKGLTFRDKI